MLLLFFLAGCSALDVFGTLGTALLPSSPGIEVSPQIGDDASKNIVVGEQSKKETNVDLEVETASHVEVVTESRETQVANEISAPVQEMVINNIAATPVWIWLLCILGWVLPTPQALVKSLWKLITFKRN